MRDVGVEDLTVEFKLQRYPGHLRELVGGWSCRCPPLYASPLHPCGLVLQQLNEGSWQMGGSPGGRQLLLHVERRPVCASHDGRSSTSMNA